jgi:hypothetical protein
LLHLNGQMIDAITNQVQDYVEEVEQGLSG